MPLEMIDAILGKMRKPGYSTYLDSDEDAFRCHKVVDLHEGDAILVAFTPCNEHWEEGFIGYTTLRRAKQGKREVELEFKSPMGGFQRPVLVRDLTSSPAISDLDFGSFFKDPRPGLASLSEAAGSANARRLGSMRWLAIMRAAAGRRQKRNLKPGGVAAEHSRLQLFGP